MVFIPFFLPVSKFWRLNLYSFSNAIIPPLCVFVFIQCCRFLAYVVCFLCHYSFHLLHCLFIFFVYFVSEHMYVFLALICTLRFSHPQLWFTFFVMSLTFWTRKELIWNIFWRFYCIYRLSCCFMWKVKVKLLKPVTAQCWKVEAVCAYKE